MLNKNKAHVHVYIPKTNSFGEKGHVCEVCGFRIPDALLPAALAAGAKIQVDNNPKV